MWNLIFNNTSLIDASGYAIIVTIAVLLVAAIVIVFWSRSRYGALERDVRRNAQAGPRFEHEVLNRIVDDVRDACTRSGPHANAQAIIEYRFQRHLARLLLGERFVRASTGLFIILGLVGTFYGLTLSIGKLVVLLSNDATEVAALTESLTAGLLQALSGMSVAFSTSLLGVIAAVVMTLLNVFFGIADRRNGLIIQLEAFLEGNVLVGSGAALGGVPLTGDDGLPLDTGSLAPIVAHFGEAVSRLDAVVARFDSAMAGFASNTRDFQEFNLHLKDNIQRMSLTFADFATSLRPVPPPAMRPPERS